MPTLAVLRGTDLTSSTAYPFTITVGGLEISQLIDFPNVRLEETASEDANGVFACRFWDADNTRDVRAEMVVHVHDDALDADRFLGTVQRVWYEGGAVGRWVNFEAVEADNLLDRTMVPYESRPIEGTAARFGYFWGYYAKGPFSGDLTYVEDVNPSLPADTYQNLTLRQTLRQIAGQSGSAVHFYVDGSGRPHLFSGTESTPGAAPYNINVALAPGGGSIAPDDLRVERDGRIVNRVYVRGANAAGSGWFTDEASKATYGPRENFLDAPSADTATKAQALALLYLGKTAEPNVRGTFTTGEPNDGWRAGQNITITSDQDDLSAYATRIVKLTTTFTTGAGKRQYVAEFATTGANLSGMPTQSSVAIVGNVVEGTLGTDSNVSLGNDQTYITSSGVVVNDGSVDRVVMGALGGGDYGARLIGSSGSTVFDGNKIQIGQSEGTVPAGVALGVSQTTVTTSGVVVNDGSVDRVVMGALGGGDYGLRITNASSTVIIDGTSNMFKIAATGTFSRTQGADSVGSTNTAITGTSLPEYTTPAFLTFLTEGTAPGANANRDLGLFQAIATGYLAQTSGGATIQRMKYILWSGHAFGSINGADPAIQLEISNADTSSHSLYVRYHVLKETAI